MERDLWPGRGRGPTGIARDAGRRDLSHSNASLCRTRMVSRSQATAARARTVRAVVCDAGATVLRVSVRYPASNRVVTIATSRPMRDAFLETSLVHGAQRSPGAIPAVGWPQRAHGWLEPAGHSPGELSGRSTAPQILGSDVVLHD